MSEFGGLWKHKNNQHALCTPEDGMWLPKVAEELNNGHIRYSSYGGTQKERNKERKTYKK